MDPKKPALGSWRLHGPHSHSSPASSGSTAKERKPNAMTPPPATAAIDVLRAHLHGCGGIATVEWAEEGWHPLTDRESVTALSHWVRVFGCCDSRGSCGFLLRAVSCPTGSAGLKTLGHQKFAAGPQQPRTEILRGKRAGYVNNPPRLHF
jgi:hypothetical protein